MQNVPVERFGGLRLDADPGELGWAGAASVSNVDRDLNGTVRSRSGYAKVSTQTTTGPAWLGYCKSGDKFILSGTALTRAFTSAWANVVSTGSASTHGIEFGTYTSSSFAGYHTVDPVAGLGFYGTLSNTFTPADGVLFGTFLAVQEPDHRLVIARSGAASDDRTNSRLAFSNASAASFAATNELLLSPIDGESIRMVVGWRELLIAFKDSKFFVFYGNSTDSTGGAIFNYRTVDTGVGCGYDYAACAAQDGVYFVHADGVYRTTGGAPELVSGALQPFFDGRTNGFFTPTGPLTTPRIHAGDDRLYVWQKGATGMFVMDLRSREWTYWVLAVAPHTLLPLPDSRQFLFTSSTGELYKFSPSSTTDEGTVIASSYQSGFAQLARGQQADVRDFDLYGTGTVTLALAADGGSVNATANGDGTVGGAVSTALATGLNSVGVGALCRDLSFKLSAASGAWNVDRLAARVQGGRDWT